MTPPSTTPGPVASQSPTVATTVPGTVTAPTIPAVATGVGQPTAAVSGTSVPENTYIPYISVDGDYQVQYPFAWTPVPIGKIGVDFLAPNGEAYAETVYTDAHQKLDGAELLSFARLVLSQGFGNNYTVRGQPEQVGKWTRVGFTLSTQKFSGPGDIYVQQQGTRVYTLIEAVQTANIDKYRDAFGRIISSYTPGATQAPSVVFKDDFSNPKSGWDTASTADYTYDYNDGTMQVLLPKARSVAASTYEKQARLTKLTDEVIDTDATLKQGPNDALFGILCRASGQQNYYELLIRPDGRYGIGKTQKGKFSILSEGSSPAIKTGKTLNHLTARCAGTGGTVTLTFLVNSIQVAQVQDKNGLAPAPFGVIGHTIDKGGLDVRFDNYVVQKP